MNNEIDTTIILAPTYVYKRAKELKRENKFGEALNLLKRYSIIGINILPDETQLHNIRQEEEENTYGKSRQEVSIKRNRS